MVKGRNGKNLLMLNGYTYYQHKNLRDGFRWSCTQMSSRSCRGFLHVTREMLVVRAQTEHTHPPSTYFLENIKTKYNNVLEFYLRPNGRINLRLNDFTFYKHLKARTNAHRWSCTAYGSKWKCKAHLIITDKLEVLKANLAHSHPPSAKKDSHKHLYQTINGLGTNKENNSAPVPNNNTNDLHPVASLHDYFIAHSVFNNY
ncbi:unnamed protein product [Parnassius mnemosyne]|uniref:FLYWCH-type domain-containing protein n=1 Tax=Parnassius mnemosyne TaxID=213953 RepID=A0AAV1K9D3_9NEOP